MYCDDNHGMMPPHIGIIEGGYYRSGYHSPNWFDWEYAYYPYAIPLKGDKDYDGFDDGSLVVICREPSYGFTPGTKVRERGHYAIIRYSKGMKAVWLPDRRLEAAGALPAWFPSMAERERAAESKERRWPYLVLGIGGGIVVGALSAWLLLRRRRCRSADPAGGGDSGGGAGRGELE